MTQPSPQDGLPPGPWTDTGDKMIMDKNRLWIADAATTAIARAIAAIPEMRATIKTQHKAIFALNKEIDHLRAENASLRQESVQYAQEADRLRVEEAELQKQNDHLRGDYPRNIGVEITEDFADNQRLRKEKAELIEMLATRTTHPEYVEVLRRYKPENETEA